MVKSKDPLCRIGNKLYFYDGHHFTSQKINKTCLGKRERVSGIKVVRLLVSKLNFYE